MPSDDFDLFQTCTEDDSWGVQLLVRLAADQLFISHSRWCVYGKTPISFRFKVCDVIPSYPDKTTKFFIQADLFDLTPAVNSTVTSWWDVETMMREGCLLVQNSEKVTIDSKPVYDHLASIAKEKHCAGGSIRWAVTVGNHGTPRLELQGLPAKESFLQRDCFRRDNVISVLLAAVKLQTILFDGAELAGPVPIIFAADRARTLKLLDENQEYFKKELVRVITTLLRMEHQSAEDAAAYLKGEARFSSLKIDCIGSYTYIRDYT